MKGLHFHIIFHVEFHTSIEMRFANANAVKKILLLDNDKVG